LRAWTFVSCVIERAKEERLLLRIFENRRHLRIGHIIRHNKFVVNILEGAISGKGAVGRPRLQYLQHVARHTGVDNYTAMKRMAANPDGKLPTDKKIEG
jgi:hypothetical protein